MAEAETGAAPYVFGAPLTLCIDIRNPLSWLALQPALALGAELGVAVECLPFMGPSLKPPKPARADDDRGARHRRQRAEYVGRDIQRYAAVRGLEIRDIYRFPDATRFAAALLWLNQHAADRVEEFLLTAFRDYWRGALDIEAPATMPEMLGRLGQDTAGFERFVRHGLSAVLADLREGLVAAGVYDTPAFVVDGQVFLGRAHLPMVRWLLRGREGQAPV